MKINLQQLVQEGVKRLKKEEGLIEGLVFASENRRTVGRLVYTTHIQSSGLLEPKSDEDRGVCVEIWFEKDGKRLIGQGSELSELSLAAIERALTKAKRDAVEDKEFFGFLKKEDLPKAKRQSKKKRPSFHFTEKEEAKKLAQMSWETLAGATEGLSEYLKKDMHFILNGDNYFGKEEVAFATTTGISVADKGSVVSSYLTAMLEDQKAKGTAWDIQENFKTFSPSEIGKQAAKAAIANRNGKRIPTGKYTVIFGPQAVSDLFTSLLLSHVNLGMVEFGASMMVGKYGEQISSPELLFYDDPTIIGAPGSKSVTDEGYPTSITMLIEKGKLVGYLSDVRTTKKVLHSPHAKELLGVDPKTISESLLPKNGFRFSRGGGRSADAGVGIYGTNVVIDSTHPISEVELLKKVQNGVFIGRLWYTYPIGGYASGIITGTAVADSYVIENGKLCTPLLPNTIRLEDNLGQMIQHIIGIANNKRPTISWMTDEVTYAPWVAMDEVQLFEINQ